MPGHIGVYIGNGLAVECTPKWDNCVQITACNRKVEGYNRRNWTKHGRLPYVTYGTGTNTTTVKTCTVTPQVLKKGSKGECVKALQRLLVSHGYNLGSQNPVDGSFGAKTDAGVRSYQKDNGLTVDGSVGRQTWTKLLGC